MVLFSLIVEFPRTRRTEVKCEMSFMEVMAVPFLEVLQTEDWPLAPASRGMTIWLFWIHESYDQGQSQPNGSANLFQKIPWKLIHGRIRRGFSSVPSQAATAGHAWPLFAQQAIFCMRWQVLPGAGTSWETVLRKHLVAVCPWTTYLTSLSLCCLIEDNNTYFTGDDQR